MQNIVFLSAFCLRERKKMRNFAPDLKNTHMSESFLSIVIYAIILGIMLATFILCGLYLILTNHPVGKPKFETNIPVRRLGGWILIILSILYIFSGRLIPFLPEWGYKDTSLWSVYIQEDALLFMIVCFPLFFLFIFNLVEKIKLEHILNIIVPVFVPIVLYIQYLIHANDLLYFCSFTYWISYVSIMSVLYIRKVKSYERRILEQHSNIDNRELWRFWLPFSLFVTTMVVGMLLGFYAGNTRILCVHIFLNICCTITLVWSVDNLEGNVDETELGISEEEKWEQLDEFTRKRLETIETSLNTEMGKGPFYLNPDFNIQEMSMRLGTNRTYLGQYFRFKNTNFYSFVNKLRIDHACSLIESDQKINLYEIAEQCGFHNTRTFRRVFEEQKGCTPMNWKQNLRGG